MTFYNMRYKHSKIIVDHAFNIFKVSSEESEIKDKWIDFLCNGGKLELMIQMIKLNLTSVVSEKSNPSGIEARIHADLVTATRMHEVV